MNAPMPMSVTTLPYASTRLVAIGASAEVGMLVMGTPVHQDGQMRMKTAPVGAPVGARVGAPVVARVGAPVVAPVAAPVEVAVVATEGGAN